MNEPSPRPAPRRVARMTLLFALNGALLAVLWIVVRPALASRASLAVPPVATASTAAPALRAVAAPRTDAPLERAIRAEVAAARQRAAAALGKRASEVTVAVHVRDAHDGAEIASLDASRALRPASNLKLATSAAALVLLGPAWSFETVLASEAPVDSAGTLAGDLVAHAGADPVFDPAAHGDVRGLLAPLARALVEKGVKRVAGDLVLDEGRYMAPAPAPEWPDAGQHWTEYCALAGGFSANAGCISAFVGPGETAVFPLGHPWPTEVDVHTGAARSRLDLRVSAAGGTVVVKGSVPAGSEPREWRFAAPDPVLAFGHALAHTLSDAGIELAGSVKRERRGPRAGERELARLATPLADVLVPINAHSNNTCADQLFLALGASQFGRGDREGGGQAVARALHELGVPGDGFVQVDGSGLSRANRISARQVTALVVGVLSRGGSAAKLLVDSLAAPGAEGTLEGRMEDLAGRVRAKTGFIAGTSGLSGLVECADGRKLAFSILVDYPEHGGLNSSVWKPMQDDICRVLAGRGGER